MFSFLKKKSLTSQKKYHFGLVLRAADGKGMLLEEDQTTKKITLIDEKNFSFTEGWDFIVENIDQIISELEELNKVKCEDIIFFLYSHFINKKENKIKPEYFEKIKKIAKDLAIKPLGYIAFNEAVVSHYKNKEESPFTSILIEFDKNNLSLFVYKGGVISYFEELNSFSDVVIDLENIFTKISNEKIVLPSRIVVYDSDKIEKESTKIIAHNWDKNLFIQLPKIEVFSKEHLKEALIDCFQNQIYSNNVISEPENENIKDENNFQTDELEDFYTEKDVKETDLFLEKKESNNFNSNNFYEQKENLKTIKTPEKNKTNFFAFLKLFNFAKYIENIRYWFNKLGNYDNRLKIGLIVGICIIPIFALIYLYFYIFYKLDLTLYVDSNKIEKKLEFTDEIKVTQKESETSKEDTAIVTGKKTIGEKAKGEITLYNYFSSEKELSKGTVLQTTSGIKFLLANDVNVASASESLGQKSAGKTTTSVVASEIGPTSNIDKNVKMAIGDYSQDDLYAVSNNSFTGGVKKDVKVVSKEDQNNLRKKILEQMKQELGSKIKTTNKNEKILDSLTNIEITDELFSKEIGEEGENFSLNAKGKASYYVIEDSQIKQKIYEKISSQVLNGYELSVNNINYVIKDVENNDENFKFDLSINVKSTKKVDKEKIIKEITGKKFADLESYLKDNYQTKGYKINSLTKSLIFQDRVPFFTKNINLRIESF